jgi:hypothetical protein
VRLLCARCSRSYEASEGPCECWECEGCGSVLTDDRHLVLWREHGYCDRCLTETAQQLLAEVERELTEVRVILLEFWTDPEPVSGLTTADLACRLIHTL